MENSQLNAVLLAITTQEDIEKRSHDKDVRYLRILKRKRATMIVALFSF